MIKTMGKKFYFLKGIGNFRYVEKEIRLGLSYSEEDGKGIIK